MKIQNKLIYPILLYFLLYTVITATYLSLSFIDNTEYQSVLASVPLIILSILFIKKHTLPIRVSLKLNIDSKSKKNLIKYTSLFAVIFLVVNSLQIFLSDSSDIHHEYLDQIWFFILICFPIKALGEEVLYRGLIQNYIDKYIKPSTKSISPGNIITAVLMTIAHLGFFYIMPLPNAILAFVQVFVVSLFFGYISKITNRNILYCTVIHIFLNYIHVAVQCFYISFIL
ncbi:CPBP family intramembrane metalloprotease [Myroides odoratimimus]|uniref:CPBP family intramembrane glutamic endopeptidase n=1 Tax=Myroides odoratimimus TaxID=76832 RepID=UPI0025772275|nr:CPBP family intramembrane glutamic endopeptidase [Myroides odoratimimus]MDM1506236.1 CPBP family intramembrane metalloprotease [Myroides odoratimimus]MDM1510388.1 CPBP family intramembrane metalloprotease [Myroides odoratimimus]MDM1526012.1 CPBP family intramembrane metalloprotease [Myroides odoratimimus]MDM1680230.1 CPBP family intramembrane metalloprotease [Myroides odoratimimus]